MRRVAVLLLLPLSVASRAGDLVESLPGYGRLPQRQLAGFTNATADGANRLHYWFVERAAGQSASTPLLLWLNGGPGSSSLLGLLFENLGPQQIALNSSLVDNPDHITKRYHLLTFDNPVGAGYSYTTSGSYVTSEVAMRTQYLRALRGFFHLHPEYSRNPFWVVGESYGGKYVPNVAYEIATNAPEIPLQGALIGNGLFNMKLQYPTLGAIAYANGVIDEHGLKEMERRQAACLERIDNSPAGAGDFCENVTVRWLYSSQGAGELFYYDLGIADGQFADTLVDVMGKYLNRPDTKAAVHAEGATWRQADEVGPVGVALQPDWAVNSDDVVARLLDMGYEVGVYNGVRDASSCNHIGNLAVLLNMSWSGAGAFRAAPSRPWPSAERVNGHLRRAGGLRYVTLLRTGHLVPRIVPAAYAELLTSFIGV